MTINVVKLDYLKFLRFSFKKDAKKEIYEYYLHHDDYQTQLMQKIMQLGFTEAVADAASSLMCDDIDEYKKWNIQLCNLNNHLYWYLEENPE